MGADTGVEADAVNDGLGVEALHFGVGVELVEIRNAQSEVSVGEELHGFGFLHADEEHGNVLFDSGFLEQACKDMSTLGEPVDVGESFDGLVLGFVFLAIHHFGNTHNDAAGIEIVVEGFRFAQELRAEEKIELLDAFLLVFHIEAAGITHGDGALDDHHGIGVHLEDCIDNGLHGRGVEEILLRIVVSGGGDDHELGVAVTGLLVEGRFEAQRLVGEIILDVVVLDRRLLMVHQINAFGNDVDSGDIIMLGQQSGDGKTDIAGTGNRNIHKKEV